MGCDRGLAASGNVVDDLTSLHMSSRIRVSAVMYGGNNNRYTLRCPGKEVPQTWY